MGDHLKGLTTWYWQRIRIVRKALGPICQGAINETAGDLKAAREAAHDLATLAIVAPPMLAQVAFDPLYSVSTDSAAPPDLKAEALRYLSDVMRETPNGSAGA